MHTNTPTSLWERAREASWLEPEVATYAARISIWARWFVWVLSVYMLAMRPDLWYPEQLAYVWLHFPLVIGNGLLHYRLLARKPITPPLLFMMSVLDLILITAAIAINGGFDSFIVFTYFPALALFAFVFAPLRLALAGTTLVVAAYVIVCISVGDGVNVAQGEENILFSRVAVMYSMVGFGGMIVRFERSRRQQAVARERELQRERIELSQAIHDTTTQTAYLIGLGIDSALALAGNENPALVDKLAATSALSKSAMWELRGPIDMGHIFEGRELGRVLSSHTATFAQITSVPAELTQSGEEPPLSTEIRSCLFTFAHNALSNAFRHADAGRVEVRLDFAENEVRLSIADNGRGLPDDYAQRGRGFRGMQVQAERLGGRLEVTSSGRGAGTTVGCAIPLGSPQTGD